MCSDKYVAGHLTLSRLNVNAEVLSLCLKDPLHRECGALQLGTGYGLVEPDAQVCKEVRDAPLRIVEGILGEEPARIGHILSQCVITG